MHSVLEAGCQQRYTTAEEDFMTVFRRAVKYDRFWRKLEKNFIIPSFIFSMPMTMFHMIQYRATVLSFTLFYTIADTEIIEAITSALLCETALKWPRWLNCGRFQYKHMKPVSLNVNLTGISVYMQRGDDFKGDDVLSDEE